MGRFCVYTTHIPTMKHLNMLLIAILISTTSSFAQKKTWIIDVNGNYDRQIFTPNRPYDPQPPLAITTWAANLFVGKSISQHFMIGLHLGYGIEENIFTYERWYGPNGPVGMAQTIYKNKSIALGLFGRYTYWLNKRFFVYSQVDASLFGYGHQYADRDVSLAYSIPYTTYKPTAGQSGLLVNLFPAIGMNIVKGLGVHADAGGINYIYGDLNSSDYQRISITFGKQFTLGLHKIIGWKKMNNTSPKQDK